MKLTYLRYESNSLRSRPFYYLILSSSAFIFTVSTGDGAPRFFFKYSIELFGLSCSSYKPTRARVR